MSIQLLARNVQNISDIEDFIKTIRVNHPQIQTWVNSNLKNWLMRVEGNKVINIWPKSDLPKWKKSIKNGEETYTVKIPVALRTQIEHIIDYFKTLPVQNIRRLDRVSVPDAAIAAKKWVDDLNKKATVNENESDTELFLACPNGYRWVKLLTDQALKREGKLMHHCVASMSELFLNKKYKFILSLRDKDNQPHVTVEVNSNSIDQIKGFANKPPTKYQEQVIILIQYMQDQYKIHRIYDLNNLNIFIYKNKIYDSINALVPYFPLNVDDLKPNMSIQEVNKLNCVMYVTNTGDYINNRNFLLEPHPKIIEIDLFTQQWLNKNKYMFIDINSKTSVVRPISDIKSDIKSGKEKLSRKHAHTFKIIQYKDNFLTFDAFDKLLPLKAPATQVKYYNKNLYCPFIWVDGYWYNITKLPDKVKITEANFFLKSDIKKNLVSTKVDKCPLVPLHKNIKRRVYNTDTVLHYGFVYDPNTKYLLKLSGNTITIYPGVLPKVLQYKGISNLTINLSHKEGFIITCYDAKRMPKLLDCAQNDIIFYRAKFDTFPNVENGSVSIYTSRTLTQFMQFNLKSLTLYKVPNVHQLPHNSRVKDLQMTNMSEVIIPNSFQVENISLQSIKGCRLPVIDIKYLFIDKSTNITIPSGIHINRLEVDKPIYFIPEDTKVDKIFITGRKVTQAKYYELFNKNRR